MRRARAASLRGALDEWEEEGPRARAAKKIHIKVKRGKPDGVTRTRRGRRRRGRGRKDKRKKDAAREKGETRSLSSLRVLFLLPLSSSALMFSLLRLSYPPFDFSCTAGIVLCRHLDLQSCRLNNRRSETARATVYIEKIENYTSV